jgi:3-oxoacyl-[acyl-carrier protein] reductase
MLKPSVVWRRCDVSNETDVMALMQWLAVSYGRLDVLVNNAGIMRLAPMPDMDLFDAITTMAVNFFGAMLATREALHIMADGPGLIVNMLSSCLVDGRPGHAAYAASKAALQAMAACASKDFREQGRAIAIVNVVPRRTWTDLRVTNFPSDRPADCLSPQDVAACVAATVGSFFCGGQDDARTLGGLMSGTTIYVA